MELSSCVLMYITQRVTVMWHVHSVAKLKRQFMWAPDVLPKLKMRRTNRIPCIRPLIKILSPAPPRNTALMIPMCRKMKMKVLQNSDKQER